MITVLDVSAAMEIILSRSGAERLRQYVLDSGKVISSDLYKAETANVLWKYVKAGLLGKDKANELLHLGLELVDEFIDIADNNEESMNESVRLNHPVYDLLYLTLARRTGATLLTLDKRLRDIAIDSGIPVND